MTYSEKHFPIREAQADEVAQVSALLKLCELDPAGVLTVGSRYWVIAAPDQSLIGVVGLEYGERAVLLRSAGVHPAWQRRGIGTRLFAHAYAMAAQAGIAKVYCFSTDAGDYWISQGFCEVPVAEVIAALPGSFQVNYYIELGYMATEVAWLKQLPVQPVQQQLAFVVEADRLKQVIRRTQLMDGSRLENSAEHSWHLALMALLLTEHTDSAVDVAHVIQMLLVHDLVEIDAGDTFAFDDQANLSKLDREQAAAERLFGMLPAAQSLQLRALWDEFEAGETAAARYANALDRLEPLLCNISNQGGTWRAHGISRTAILQRMDPIRTGAPGLWPFVLAAVDAACANGWV